MSSLNQKSESLTIPGNSNSSNGARTIAPLRTILSSGVSIKGSVKFRTELIIDGKVEGTIDSVGRLTVGKNAHIRGEIRTRSITVHGTVDGNLTAGERCELRSGCTLRGEIEACRLVVEEDVTFTGSAAIEDHLSGLRVVSPRVG
jgi:cytoskeletal protein CcmA (bactofilin family)